MRVRKYIRGALTAATPGREMEGERRERKAPCCMTPAQERVAPSTEVVAVHPSRCGVQREDHGTASSGVLAQTGRGALAGTEAEDEQAEGRCAPGVALHVAHMAMEAAETDAEEDEAVNATARLRGPPRCYFPQRPERRQWMRGEFADR